MIVADVVCAIPRRAWRASMTARISRGACWTASSMTFSSFTMTGCDVIHFFQVIRQRRLERRLLEMDVRLDPLHILLGPGFQSFRPAAVSQQKLPQPVTCFQLV